MAECGDVWAEINLDNLKHNFNTVKRVLSPKTRIMGIVKADAYGHGLCEVAHKLSKEGIDYFGVASIDEGIELVNNGVKKPILVLRSVVPGRIELLLDYGLIPSVNCISLAREAELYGKKRNKKIKIHIRVDTCGEGDGIPFRECPGFLDELSGMRWIETEGIYTHLVSAYGAEKEAVKTQLANFNQVLDYAKKHDIYIPIIHAASSPSLFAFPESHFNMVRTGTALYGLPFSSNQREESLKPVMQLKSRVVCIKEYTDGYSMGYGKKYIIREPLRIATVSIGYADAGFLLKAENLKIIIGGEFVHIYGNAHMDHIKVDITGLNRIGIGDEAVIFGTGGGKTIDAVDTAKLCGISTVNCESVCFLGGRVNRIYFENGKVSEVKGTSQAFYPAGTAVCS